MGTESKYMTMHEAAEYLGVSRRRVWELTRTGQLTAIRNPLDRREKLIEREQVQQFADFARIKKEAA